MRLLTNYQLNNKINSPRTSLSTSYLDLLTNNLKNMKHHKNILKSNIIIKFLLKYLLVSLILTIAILAHTNFAKATSYQRDPAGTLIPNGTSVTVTASGIDFSSVCGVGNSWGLYMLRSDSVNPNGAILSDSLNGTGGSMTWTFTNLPSGGYAEVGAICYTGTAGALGNNPYYSYVYFNNQRAKIVLESGTPAFTVTPLTITTTMLPDARVAVAFSQTLQATNGAVPFTWSILSGSLPAGLSLNSSTGKISGIPTTVETANFIVKVTDTTSAYATRELSLRVLPEIIISTASFLTDTVTTPYSKTLRATGAAFP